MTVYLRLVSRSGRLWRRARLAGAAGLGDGPLGPRLRLIGTASRLPALVAFGDGPLGPRLRLIGPASRLPALVAFGDGPLGPRLRLIGTASRLPLWSPSATGRSGPGCASSAQPLVSRSGRLRRRAARAPAAP